MKTRVDFYVIPEAEDTGPVLTACKLCDKAHAAGKKVWVHAPDAALASDFDEVLWTFRQGSFIAHERLQPTTVHPEMNAVLIGSGEPPASHTDVLVNLGPDIPAHFSRFERVLEIVHGDTAQRERLRSRFKFYRDKGCALETHKLA